MNSDQDPFSEPKGIRNRPGADQEIRPGEEQELTKNILGIRWLEAESTGTEGRTETELELFVMDYS